MTPPIGAGRPAGPKPSGPRPSGARPAGPERSRDSSAAATERNDLAALLADCLAGLGLDLPASARASLLDYLELIVRWNRSFNLTAIRDPRAMVVAHLADSLALVPLLAGLPDGSVVVDVGSGAGLPGIPVQLARPGLRVELVEPVGKKAAFLRQCRAELGLPQLGVHEARVENIRLDTEPAVITSRAFASLADFATAVAGIAGPSSRLLAMKGARPDAELEELAARALPWRLIAVEPLTVPGLDAQRCVVVLEPQPQSPAPNPTEP